MDLTYCHGPAAKLMLKMKIFVIRANLLCSKTRETIEETFHIFVRTENLVALLQPRNKFTEQFHFRVNTVTRKP